MPSLRLHRLLIAASLVVPAGLFAASALHNRADVLREGEDMVVRTAAVMDEHARKVFETGELVLARVDGQIHGQSWEQIAAPETSAFLARLKAPLDHIVSIWITDAQGVVRAGSQDWDPAVTIAERDFFQVQRERDAGTYVSPAFRGKATGLASFALSQRRSTPDGRFDGIVHISLSPDYFVRTYAATTPDLAHDAVLVRADGAILARDPDHGDIPPLSPGNPLMRQIAQHPEAGFYFARSKLDTADRAYAYRRVAAYPVYVRFGVDKAVLLHRWHVNLVLFGAAAAVASLMLLLVSWRALSGVKAERATMARLRTALDDLRRETAQREAAEQRVRQVQKMEAVGQLTGGVAHDFNNLLTAVLGSLQLLGKRLPPDDERAARLLANAVQGAQRGASLTQRLLAFSRSQALKPETVEIPALVQGMSDLLRSSLGAGVRVETDLPASMAAVLVDANQLELALLNLVVNARDAMPGGGHLAISGREETIGAGRDCELPPGGYVVLAVADTGEGMDEATLARCVEPFFTTKGVGKGTGLGLSMVYGLAAQSGGRLVLRSRPGEGTVAELWLPQAGEHPAAAPPGTEAPAGDPKPLHGRSVLLVDDDPLVLASTASMLDDLGYAVLEAMSGAEALNRLRGGARVDVVVTDQSMPGMTGLHLAAELRRQWPALPVLVASGFADAGDLAESGLPLVAKPFEQPVLAAAVEACLEAAGWPRAVAVP